MASLPSAMALTSGRRRPSQQASAAITASFERGPGIITGSATLTVIAPTAAEYRHDPTDPGPADRAQVRATTLPVRTRTVTPVDITDHVSWSSSQTSFATVSNAGATKGEVTPVAAGATTIIAQLGTVSGSSHLARQRRDRHVDCRHPGVPHCPSPRVRPSNTRPSQRTRDGSTNDVTSQATWIVERAARAGDGHHRITRWSRHSSERDSGRGAPSARRTVVRAGRRSWR